jgi:outer membrane protein assembly factor BamB
LFGNLLLVAYSSGELFALNALNGREQWEDNLASSRRGGGVMGIAAIRGQPVLTAEGSAALAISNSGRLVAIDTRSGQRVWDQRLAGNQMPWVAGSTVFLLTSQSQLMALNLADGKIRWLTQLAQWENGKEHSGVISWYGPVLAGGKLWITSSTGRLRSYSPEDGAEAADLDAGRAINRPPVVAGGTLYTLDDSATLTAWR